MGRVFMSDVKAGAVPDGNGAVISAIRQISHIRQTGPINAI
jgi:hypothetical protein